ncbi:MAG: DUF262 domain-containing protein [Chloroflexi bacterium AL-W]|nr:DUF262 domain-containing protein [Chloroflexi bacterium AL-N1]NOK71046.1 DUF262 domain-containing protein [Chloroflexi bacterium AL-N10]NOK72731.1 DUF262 domain-containing protein [Chloroflexi bacterium AL-N5]NOK79181.1 DUF262 domain-containing protein [Chloroflexi bacterium AL-W]NOK87096.1 DUF262 domain-containing protein [Chloroflexi bacterium AL-N15]
MTTIINKRNVNKSNKLLAKTYLRLRGKVEQRVSELGEDKGKILFQIIDCIRNKLVVIIITVSDLVNAYLIFETLNDRGLDLSVADLLKNYFFSRSSGRIADVRKNWKDMNTSLVRTGLTRFIRHYWLSNRKVIREKDLYKVICTEVKNPIEVTNFVEKLKNAAEIYGAFEDPQSAMWDGYDTNVRENLNLLVLFNVNLCYPVLLAIHQTVPDNLEKVLRMLVIITFRYNVICNNSTSHLEYVYSEVATWIREQKPKKIKPIFEKMAKIYPSDEEFKGCFEGKVLPKTGSRLARYILQEINNAHLGDDKELVTNLNEKDLNLEHILPQNPDEPWIQTFPSDEDISQYIYRIGNMTLLGTSMNRKQARSSFDEKLSTAYSQSKIKITSDLVNYSTWGLEEIRQRQASMAKVACQVWRLDY